MFQATSLFPLASLVVEAPSSSAALERIWSAAKFQAEDRERLKIAPYLPLISPNCPPIAPTFYNAAREATELGCNSEAKPDPDPGCNSEAQPAATQKPSQIHPWPQLRSEAEWLQLRIPSQLFQPDCSKNQSLSYRKERKKKLGG